MKWCGMEMSEISVTLLGFSTGRENVKSKAQRKHRYWESASLAGDLGGLWSRANSSWSRGTRWASRLPESVRVSVRDSLTPPTGPGYSSQPKIAWSANNSWPNHLPLSKQSTPTSRSWFRANRKLLCPVSQAQQRSAGTNRKFLCPDRQSASSWTAQAQWGFGGVVGGEEEELEGGGSRSQKMAEAGVSWGSPCEARELWCWGKRPEEGDGLREEEPLVFLQARNPAGSG